MYTTKYIKGGDRTTRTAARAMPGRTGAYPPSSGRSVTPIMLGTTGSVPLPPAYNKGGKVVSKKKR